MHPAARHLAMLTAGIIAIAGAAPPAGAVEIFLTPGALQPSENVLFQGNVLSDTALTAIANRTGSSVTFNGNAKLATQGRGQASISGLRAAG